MDSITVAATTAVVARAQQEITMTTAATMTMVRLPSAVLFSLCVCVAFEFLGSQHVLYHVVFPGFFTFLYTTFYANLLFNVCS